MRKVWIVMLGAGLLLSSCDTYTGMGAYTGAQIGSVIGSAIGGITGGGRGADLGTLIGMAGGAAVGAAVGSAADKSREEQDAVYQRPYGDERQFPVQQTQPREDQSGFDASHGGDDRIELDIEGPKELTLPGDSVAACCVADTIVGAADSVSHVAAAVVCPPDSLCCQ